MNSTEPEPEQVRKADAPKPERHRPQNVMTYAEHVSDFDHEGYYWLVLPKQIPTFSFADIFGSPNQGEVRVLACERCGQVVGEPSKHNTWHKDMDELIKTLAELTERSQ